MSGVEALTHRLGAEYPNLPPQLRKAARYIAKAPTDVALYSLREIAARARVGPTTLVRLAEQLGFDSYSAFREIFRDNLRSGADRYAIKAEQLQHFRAGADFAALYRDTGALTSKNISDTFASISAADIAGAAGIIRRARQVYILGLRCNYCLSFYLYYLLRTFMRNVLLLEDRMGMLIDELGGIGAEDVLVAFSYEPYAAEAVKAAKHAAMQDASIIAFTDTILSPIAHNAAKVFLLPTAGTSFYQSLVPTMALLEGVVCCLVAGGGPRVVARVKEEFRRRDAFGVYWSDEKGRPERSYGTDVPIT